ncbi:MAG: universal stress protein [Arcobacter butzleri]|nr:universal stress protein [Aliarcobacter butzleri]
MSEGDNKEIFACVDDSKYSKDVCDYGIDISKATKSPLKILNVIEYSKINKLKNKAISTQDEFLKHLSNDDDKQIVFNAINKSNKLLQEYEQNAIDAGLKKVSIVQKYGTFYDSVVELKEQIRLLIIGYVQKQNDENIIILGKQVEQIIRDSELPVLLINQKFKPVKRIMMAYDGSPSSIKALQGIMQSPLLRSDVIRYIVNVNNDIEKSKQIIDKASEILDKSNLNFELVSLKGDDHVNELIKFQYENDIDMVVMGAFGRGKIRRAIFGSFTSKMLQNNPKPLLLIK